MRRPLQKTLREKHEAALTAAAFAEESDVETSRPILSPRPSSGRRRGPSRR